MANSIGNMIRRVVVVLVTSGALGGAAIPLLAQEPSFSNGTLTFDVASIHQNIEGESAQGANRPHVNFPIGSDDAFYDTGGVFSATNMPLISYIIFAYKINTNNRQALIDSAPSRVNTDRYNIEARTDLKDVTKDQMRLMMQALLRDRFGLQVHRETRTVSAYGATLDHPGKPGPQLREHPKEAPCSQEGPANLGTSSPPTLDPSGFPQVCGRFVNSMKSDKPHHRRVGGGNLPMATIVSGFTGLGDLNRPVIDSTGLRGLYDFFLDFVPDPPPGRELPLDEEGPTFMQAIKSQLGLRLVSDHAPIEFVLVDHLGTLTGN